MATGGAWRQNLRDAHTENIAAASAARLGRDAGTRFSGTAKKIQSATAHDRAHSSPRTPRHPITGSAACAGTVASMLPRTPMAWPIALMRATLAGANQSVFALMSAIKPAETATPRTTRAAAKPANPSESAKRAKPPAVTRPSAACRRRGPIRSSASPSGSCASAYAANMHAASRPSSRAESANSRASAGPMMAITVREAWLMRFSPESGSVTFAKTRHSALMRPGLFLQRVRVDDVDRRSLGEGDDLVEDVAELDLVFIARDVADVRRRDDVRHLEERVVGVLYRLLLVDVHRGHSGAARFQRVFQGVLFDQAGPAGVDDHRGRLHAREVRGLDDAARRVDQAHVQRDHVAFFEECLLALRRRVPVRACLLARGVARPDLDVHAKGLPIGGDDLADPPVAVDAERLAAPGEGVDVDVRIDAPLADQLQLWHPLDERGADLGALADEDERFGVLQPLGELVGVLDVVVPDLDV